MADAPYIPTDDTIRQTVAELLRIMVEHVMPVMRADPACGFDDFSPEVAIRLTRRDGTALNYRLSISPDECDD